MAPLIEPIRYTTSIFAVITAFVMVSALTGTERGRAPILRLVPIWLAVAIAVGTFFTHVLPALLAPQLLPAGAIAGLALGVATLFSPGVDARFAALEDRQWRLLTLLRAVFGALLLASGAAGLLPTTFALPAGLGDLVVAALAVVVPGSLAAGGHRGHRLLVFGVGIVDFISVIALIVTVLVPWLAETHGIGLTLLLPWVAVPLLATLNLFGLRQVLRELVRVRVTIA